MTVLFDARSGGSNASRFFGGSTGRPSAEVIGVDANSGARRTVFTASSSQSQEAAWGPTGDFFVYTSNSTGTWSLVRSLTNSPNAAVAIIIGGEVAPAVSVPDVSPDGKRVAFATFLRQTWHIAISDITGANFTLIGEGYNPAWSPDGKRLAFVRVADRRAHIYTVDAATGTDVVKLTAGDFDNVDPDWAPDGSRIVFSSNRTARKAAGRYDVQKNEMLGQYNLFTIQTDGTALMQLTDGNGIAADPDWGRDGWIYFTSNQAGNFDIWRLKAPAM